jgi:hypothetical protein
LRWKHHAINPIEAAEQREVEQSNEGKKRAQIQGPEEANPTAAPVKLMDISSAPKFNLKKVIPGETQKEVSHQPAIPGAEILQKRSQMKELEEARKQKQQIQMQSIMDWMNSHLEKRNMKVTNLQEDLRDGILLANLIEVLANTTLKITTAPKLPSQKLDNINKCLVVSLCSKKCNLLIIGIEVAGSTHIRMSARRYNCLILYY